MVVRISQKLLSLCQVICFTDIYLDKARLPSAVDHFGFHFDNAYYNAIVSFLIGTAKCSSIDDRLNVGQTC